MPRFTPQVILLVDGYNIIGAWAGLKQTRDRKGLEEARRELVEALVGYSSFQGYETQVIFDAQYQGTPGSREIVTPHLSIGYTDFLQTADSYIEQACAKFRQDVRKFSHRLIVATSDRAQQLTVMGYGAEWLSAMQLYADVESMTHRIRDRQKQKGRSPGRFLAHSLDPISRQRLAQLRLGQNAD
jgi:hypothetical protein